MPQPEHDNVIISEQTESSISCISDHLDDWIPDGMTVVIVSPEDLENCEAFYNTLPESFRQHVSLDEFSKLKGRGACAGRHDIDGDGINDIGYILTPSITTTKEEIANGYANIQAENLVLPGSDDEWRAAVVAHEIGHLDQKPKLVRGRLSLLGLEMEADQNSIDHFLQINADVAQARIQCRALGAFGSSTAFQNSHITSAGVSISPDDHAPHVSDLTHEQHIETYEEILQENDELNILTPVDIQEFEDAIREDRTINEEILSPDATGYWLEKCRYEAALQYAQGLSHARDMVYRTLGVQDFEFRDAHGEFAIPLPFKKQILEGTRPGNPKAQNQNLTPQDQAIVEQIMADKIPFDEGLELLSPELVENYNFHLNRFTVSIGDNISNNSPSAFYHATAELYRAGAFAENPIGEQYAWEFLEAGRTLAAEYFEVPSDTQPFTAPQHDHTLEASSLHQPFHGVTPAHTAASPR